MADNKTDTKVEREYIIPLRNQWKRVPRYKKANKAIKAIKEFLVRHMKIRDSDLSKVKIDKYLNEEIWFRGIRKPPSKIKVKAIKEGDIVKVKLAELPVNLKFKKAREEKREQIATDIVKDKIKELEEQPEEKPKEGDKAKEEDETKKEEAKEKKAAVVESVEKMEKEIAKKAKHDVGGKTKQPKHQVRKALAK